MQASLILASTSVYRRQLLQRLGLPFDCVAPAVDEQAMAAGLTDPEQIAQRLAHAKAVNVSAKHPASVVVGSDQVVDFEGTILGKPGTQECAVQQILNMAGKTHRLITAVCVMGQGRSTMLLNRTQLKMRALSQVEVERYVALDHPLDCAGSYKIESAGISLFDHIECSDFTAIVGLPLLQLSQELRCRGFAIP